MAKTAEGQKHLLWCADRALLEFDDGGVDEALASVMSDFPKSELTEGIDPMLVVMVVTRGARKGREGLKEAIMGFNV